MTLRYLEIVIGTKHRAASPRKLSFLFFYTVIDCMYQDSGLCQTLSFVLVLSDSSLINYQGSAVK